MEQFGRQVHLQFGPAGGVGKSISGLRTRFKIEMSRTPSPHKGVITVYNLGEISYAMLQDPTVLVRLLVGYSVPQQIFQGEPITNGLDRVWQGTDSVTTIEVQDGGKAFKETHVSFSFATETSYQQVFNLVAAAMGLPTGMVVIDPTLVFPEGITYSGPAAPMLDRIALASSGDWFITDGALQVLPRDGALGAPAVLFSSSNGNLIGSPNRKADGKVEITGLISPGMRPGSLFLVQSRYVNGTFIAEDLVFEGDDGYEQAFYVHATGRPLLAVAA